VLIGINDISTKAAEAVPGVCPKEFPRTSADGLAFMEKRLDAMLQAIKIVRPAFDGFYASLNDEQKAPPKRGRPPQSDSRKRLLYERIVTLFLQMSARYVWTVAHAS
jgi:hypothetical protein